MESHKVFFGGSCVSQHGFPLPERFFGGYSGGYCDQARTRLQSFRCFSSIFKCYNLMCLSFLLYLKSPLFFSTSKNHPKKPRWFQPCQRRWEFFQELAPDIKSPERKVTEGSLWQADHVVPVWRGGGLCGLENLQTLCTACHSAKTKAEARERKEDPRMGEFWLASFLDKVGKLVTMKKNRHLRCKHVHFI